MVKTSSSLTCRDHVIIVMQATLPLLESRSKRRPAFSQNCKVAFLRGPLGDLNGNVSASFSVLCKARGWLPTGDNLFVNCYPGDITSRNTSLVWFFEVGQ